MRVEAEMQAQLAALEASFYTITVRDGRTKRGFLDRHLTAQQVLRKIGQWTKKNQNGDDIYITPESQNCYYIVIDDVKRTDDVYKYGPCYIQETSRDNFQVIVKYRVSVVEKGDVFWRAATSACGMLNKLHGDPKVSNPRQAFRLVGFMNKKPDRGDFQVRSLFCEPEQYASDFFEEIVWREKKKIEAAEAVKAQKSAAIEAAGAGGDFEAAVRFFNKEKKKLLGRCRVLHWTVDMSRIDYQIVKEMHKAGFSKDVVSDVLLKAGDVHSRHRDPNGYVSLTVSKFY